MGRLYFVRHGETYWNVENKICGKTDIALTPFGHEQAVRTAEKILKSGIRFDEIISSPLIRAADTAKHISMITGIPLRLDDRLIEQNFGRYEATARNGKEFQKAKEQFADRFRDGESMLHLAQRIYNLLDELRQDPKGRSYLLVAHNGIARVVESYFRPMTNEEYATFGVKNCAVLCYDWENGREDCIL